MNAVYRQELEQFKGVTEEMAARGHCEGSCDEHHGPVSVVRAIGRDGFDWGYFSYCEAAKETDRQRGFTLEQVEA
jgi:hypothetical protein